MVQKKVHNEDEKTVEAKLFAIAKLQKALSDIDKIRILRGELPLEVQDIEDDIKGSQTRLDNLSAAAKALTHSISNERTKISASRELLEKYRRQLDHVRNNREYDNLSKEIEYQDLETQLSEKRIKEYTQELSGRKEEIASLKEKIELRMGDLKQKESELDNIIKDTRDEEEKLLKEAKSLEADIKDERLLAGFYRIRNATHNGLAVVPIDRDACGGCFNRIPPQRQLEIRLAKKIIICEYCGRIIVDPILFDEGTTLTEEGIVTAVPQIDTNAEQQDNEQEKKPATKRATTRKKTEAKANSEE